MADRLHMLDSELHDSLATILRELDHSRDLIRERNSLVQPSTGITELLRRNITTEPATLKQIVKRCQSEEVTVTTNVVSAALSRMVKKGEAVKVERGVYAKS